MDSTFETYFMMLIQISSNGGMMKIVNVNQKFYIGYNR